MRFARLLSLVLVLASQDATAQAPTIHGYFDVRAVAAPDSRSFVDGGLGKTRFGAGDDGFQFGGAALQAAWPFATEWLAVASAQVQTTDESTLDLLEAYANEPVEA
jgi:hypothetical protein